MVAWSKGSWLVTIRNNAPKSGNPARESRGGWPLFCRLLLWTVRAPR